MWLSGHGTEGMTLTEILSSLASIVQRAKYDPATGHIISKPEQPPYKLENPFSPAPEERPMADTYSAFEPVVAQIGRKSKKKYPDINAYAEALGIPPEAIKFVDTPQGTPGGADAMGSVVSLANLEESGHWPPRPSHPLPVYVNPTLVKSTAKSLKADPRALDRYVRMHELQHVKDYMNGVLPGQSKEHFSGMPESIWEDAVLQSLEK